MSGTAITDGNARTAPGATSKLPFHDSANPTATSTMDRAATLYWLGRIDEITVAASTTLALTYAAHQGRMIILAGASAAFTLNATNELTGFTCEIVNRTGSAYTVPSVTGATLNMPSGHTKISSTGRATITLYTHGGTIYASVRGDTEA